MQRACVGKGHKSARLRSPIPSGTMSDARRRLSECSVLNPAEVPSPGLWPLSYVRVSALPGRAARRLDVLRLGRLDVWVLVQRRLGGDLERLPEARPRIDGP